MTPPQPLLSPSVPGRPTRELCQHRGSEGTAGAEHLAMGQRRHSRPQETPPSPRATGGGGRASGGRAPINPHDRSWRNVWWLWGGTRGHCPPRATRGWG